MTEKKSAARPDPFANVPGRTDIKRQEAGDWFSHEQVPGFKALVDRDGNGLRAVKVRGRQTQDYEDAQEKLAIQGLRMDTEERYRFNVEQGQRILAKHCVVEWDWTDADGNEIPCTHPLKERVFKDKSLTTAADFITAAIQLIEGKVRVVAEADEGKSEPRSGARSSGVA